MKIHIRNVAILMEVLDFTDTFALSCEELV
jgi:hypothetical protein